MRGPGLGHGGAGQHRDMHVTDSQSPRNTTSSLLAESAGIPKLGTLGT